MDQKLIEFLELNKLFEDNGFSLYMVGGTVRDYLMGLPLDDMDVVTDATPEDIKKFLPDASYVFARFGSVSFTPGGENGQLIFPGSEQGGGKHCGGPDRLQAPGT